ncbi:MAG: alpha-hydroxy acid oxidase, partial [Deltaproteobacteria bacterium]
TLRRNRDAIRAIEIWPRVLVDVGAIDLHTTVLGTTIDLPVLVAPMAAQRLAHPEGELAMARAAARAGTVNVVSTLSTVPLEAIAAASTGPRWFQLYAHRDRGLTMSLMERAAEAGYRALVLTVDAPVLGRRLADVRNGFKLPTGLTMANFEAAASKSTEAHESALAGYVATRHDPTLTWRDLDWIRTHANMPLVLKGILRADDARRAVEHGADAIIVSNHGGRQLDGTPAAIDALEEIVDAVAGRCEVLMDGGIRWGTDVLKALALGARAVLVGRPLLWGLAVGGEQGVQRVFDILRDDLTTAMTLTGCPTVPAVDRTVVRRAPQ